MSSPLAVWMALSSLISVTRVAALAGQTPLGKEAANLRAHVALQALDRYLETWNSRDPERWASSLGFRTSGPDQARSSCFGRQRTWYETRLDQAEVVQVKAPTG